MGLRLRERTEPLQPSRSSGGQRKLPIILMRDVFEFLSTLGYSATGVYPELSERSHIWTTQACLPSNAQGCNQTAWQENSVSKLSRRSAKRWLKLAISSPSDKLIKWSGSVKLNV